MGMLEGKSYCGFWGKSFDFVSGQNKKNLSNADTSLKLTKFLVCECPL